MNNLKLNNYNYFFLSFPKVFFDKDFILEGFSVICKYQRKYELRE